MNRFLVSGLSLFFLACSPAPEEVPEPPAAEATVPSISILDYAGLEAAVEAREGSGYLLNFWALWCAPCVEELPHLVHVAQRYRERGGEVIGVSYDLMIPGDDATSIMPKMTSFMQRRTIDLPVWIYDEDDYEQINARFDLPGEVPVTLAIDKDGKIVDRQEGAADEARFEDMMRKALGI